MFEHSLQRVGHNSADFMFVEATRPREFIQHADHKQRVAVASPMERSSKRLVKGRLSESPCDVIVGVIASQLVQRQNLALRMDLEFLLDAAKRMAAASQIGRPV